MVRIVQLASRLNQNHIVITADLAIYSKAREILWNNPPELAGRVTLQLGGIYLTMAFIANIGYIFGDGGLTSILVKADIFAENSCRLMLKGKQYSRAIRGLTLAADAISRLLYDILANWYEENKRETFINDDVKHLMNSIISMMRKSKIDENNFKNIITKIEDYDQITTEFINSGCTSTVTFKYWYFFLETIDLLWRMLHAETDGDFYFHLAAVHDVLPYLSAAGRNLYLKWVSVYLSDMEELKHQIPYMYDFLASGNFVVKKTN
ncbi:hypothetical protein NQ314_005872 [Rhamnusium bicolor]|uniref:Uncharacterized protein n=1 Tax=Rhamnusium bicolor TaxID=1586634 RepID=A0AAV8ZC57_9CUCU|nr:hypothetical protein NQ314_005872 [Rhamnusium bicolor]